MSDDRHFQFNPTQLPCAFVRDDLDAWALGGLDEEEVARIEQHLAECSECRAEADHWLKVASTLPLSLVPVSPPAETKQRLMQKIADDQMRAVSPSLPRTTTTQSSASRPMLRRFTWSQALVAPLIVALIVVSSWAFSLRDQVETLETGDLQVPATDDFMLPAGVQTFSLNTECQQCTSAGRLLADPKTANALFVAWNLDPAMVHQVWCVDDQGARTMVASLKVTQSGDVVQPLVFEKPISGYSQIYVMSKDDGNEQMMEMNETPMSTPPSVPDL